MSKRLKTGDKVFWYGTGSQKNNMFTGTIKRPAYVRENGLLSAEVEADENQGFFFKYNLIYHKNLKKRK